MKEQITTTLRWAGDWPWWMGLGGGLMLAALAWLLYRREGFDHRWFVRLLLPGLRSLAVLMIVLMLSGPVLHQRKVIGEFARVLVVVDGSESMQLTDPAMEPARKLALARRLGLLEGVTGTDPDAEPLRTALARVDALPRSARLQALLLEGRPEQRLLTRLAQNHDVQLVTLNDGAITPIWRPSSEDSTPPGVLPLPAGVTTNLTSGLTFAASDATPAEKGAVILLSDGQHNSGRAPLEAARVLGERHLPVYTVGFGSTVPPRDLAVLRVIAPETVFKEDRVRGEVQLKEDAPPGQPFTLTVKDGENVVWQKTLVTEGLPLRRVPFEFEAKALAESRLKKPPLAGYEALGAAVELQVAISGFTGDRESSNDETPLRFQAVTQKRKILILDGRPRWETRYLRNLFERDDKWEINAVIAGATNDAGFPRGERPGTFPNDAKLLDAYDLIIFGEVPRTLLREQEMEWVVDFTEKRGGALLFIDGARGTLRPYLDTPLGPLLPVEWTVGSQPIREGIRSLALTERAARLGAFTLSADLSTNAETWAKLPAPHWLSGATPLPGAETLIEADIGTGRIPVAVLRPFGAGRVYYHAFDDSWRWRYEVADEYHVKFWNQLADFLVEPPFAAHDRYISVDSGPITYQRGDHADLRARLRDRDGRPVTEAAVSAVLYKDGAKVATIALTPGEGGLYRGQTAALEPGEYEMAIETAAVPEGELKARSQFKVIPPANAERTLLTVNEDLLRQISTASGGEYFREEQIDSLLEKLAPLSTGHAEESDTVLWQHWWWFIPLVLLLSLEWIIRKRSGLL